MVVQYEKTCTPFKLLELCRCATVGIWLRNHSPPSVSRPCSLNCTTGKHQAVKGRTRPSRSVGTSVAFDGNREGQVLSKKSGTVFDPPSIPDRRQTLPISNSSAFYSKSRRGRRRNPPDSIEKAFNNYEAEAIFLSSPCHEAAALDSERQFSSAPQFVYDQHLSCAESTGGSLSGSTLPDYHTSWGYNQNALLLYQSSIQSKWHSPHLSDGCAPEPRQNSLSPTFELQSAPSLVENFCKHHHNQQILSRSIASSQPGVKYEKQGNLSSDYSRSVADCPNEQSGGAFIRNSAKDIYKHSAAPISSSSTTIGTSTASNASTGTCARHSRQWKVCENHQKQHNITSSNFDHWYFNQALTAAATTQNYLSPYSSHVSTQGEPEEQLMISVQSLPENNSRGYNMNKQINSFPSDRRFEHAVQIPFGGNSRYSFHNPDFNHPRRPTSRVPSLNKQQTINNLPPVEENLAIPQPPRQAASGNELESVRRTSAAFLNSKELPYANSRQTNSLVASSALKGSGDQAFNSSCPTGDHLVAKCMNYVRDTPNADESTSIWKLRQPPPPLTASNESSQNSESTEWSAPRESTASRSYRLVVAPPTKDLPKKPANVYQQAGLFNKELDFQSPIGNNRTSISPARLISSSSRFTASKTTSSVQLPVKQQPRPQQQARSSQDIWVRQVELAVKETDNPSVSESSSPLIEEELEMAPQRSFKIIDPCLHSPIHPAYKTADMKQSRTSVSIQNDSYNFGPPSSRDKSRITTTQSISGLDSYNSESPESEELLPLNELYGAWGSDVDDIVTSYEKLDIEEKTSSRSKFNDVWTGRNQMKPPPFKTAVASLNSLRMSSNFNLSDCHVTGDDMASRNVKRFTTSLVDINEKSSNSPHMVTSSQQNGKAKLEATNSPSSNLFSTQSELNVTGNRRESMPQNSLKNCRSELLLAETLTSVKSLSLRPRDRSKPNFTRSSSQKTKSSNDITSISELTISDEFTRGLSRSKYQGSTSSSRLRSTSFHSDEIKEENEDTIDESVEAIDKNSLQSEKSVNSSLNTIPSSSAVFSGKRNELLKDDNTEKHRHEIAAISYHHGAITNAEPCECRKKAKQLYSGPASQEKNDAAVSAASAAEGTKLFEEDGAKSNTSNFGYSSNDDSGSSSSTGCGSPSLVMPSTSSTATMDTAASSSISSAGPVHNIAPAIQAVSDALSSLENVSFRPEKKSRGLDNQNSLIDHPLIDMMDGPPDRIEMTAIPRDKTETDSDLYDFTHENEVGDNFADLFKPKPEFASVEEYPEFTGEENQRDLSIAFAEFASAISDLITNADTDKPLQSCPSPQAAVKKKPKLPKIQTSPIHSSPEASDVTPTNEREENTKLKQHYKPIIITNYNSLYADLDMKVDEFLQNCPPGKSIEFLLERLARPKSIQVYQKLIGRSKSLPGSLNETANIGKLRPLRVPRHLKSHWDTRLRRRSPESKRNVNLEFVGKNMIPRRHKSKRKFLRDDPDRCKSVPLTKVEIHCLSDHSNTDGISSLPSVTNINELGLYEYVDVDSELNFSMQKMFVNSSSSSSLDNSLSPNRPLSNPETFHPFQSNSTPSGHLPTLPENPSLDSNPVPVQIQIQNSSAINTSNSEPISKSETIQERLSTSAASTCANVDVSQLIFDLCNSDDFSEDYPYDDDDEGGGIREPDPNEFSENEEFNDEYFASELIEPQSYQISPKQFQTSLNGLTSQQHPPPVLPYMTNARQMIERSATYPRTLDEITECANE